MSEIFDEASYVRYAESVIFDLQNSFRKKTGLDNIPVIEMSAMLEEICFRKALIDNEPIPSGDCLWIKKECIYQYQNQCEKMLRNLEFKERNWRKIFEENEKNAKIVLAVIMKEEDGGRRKVDAYRSAPKAIKPIKPTAVRLPPAERLKNLTAGGSKATGGAKAKGKGGNKKGPIGKKREDTTAASSGLLNETVDKMKVAGGGGSGGKKSTIANAPTSSSSNALSSLLVPDPLLNISGIVDDDFLNLDMFSGDEEGSYSVHLSNPEAWQAPVGLNIQGADQVGENTDSNQLWRSAVAERESSVSREQALQQQRDTQQEILRKNREEDLQNLAAKREEDERAVKEGEERVKREKIEAQERTERARELERKKREEIGQSANTDDDRNLLDE